MRFTIFFLCILSLFTASYGQNPNDVLATMNGRSFTVRDLSPNIAKPWIEIEDILAKARKTLLDRQIQTVLLETEAKARKTSVAKLFELEVTKKVPDPTEAQIKAAYEANSKDLVGVPLAKVRKQIIDYLRVEPQAKARAEFLKTLKAKHKIAFIKAVTSSNLIPTDVLATVGKTIIRAADFTKKNGFILYEYRANIYDQVSASLTQAVDSALYMMEAQAHGISASEYIAREITNKMTSYSDEEQYRLQTSLRKQLYGKYRVRFFIKEPKPFVQQISTDDDPAIGNKGAPVTVVMFTDLQCPACSTAYPIIKRVILEYGNLVYFVVRDFPLTSRHENAFQAAVAANAAKAQNKYFEFKELLYKNQDSLDTESLVKFAKQLGLNEKRFASDLKNKKFADEVRKDIADGNSYGVNSTPTVFVNGIKVRVLSEEGIRKTIDKFVR